MPQEWIKRPTRKPKSAKDLLARELPPVKWAVRGVLPEGVTILAGKPKMGKSWLAMGLCVAVASGGYALGKIPVEKGAALYLALEDNERRFQNRLRKVLAGGECPDGLDYEIEWDPLIEGGVESIREWLAGHPDARLVVIDILKRVRSRESGGRSMYDVDYEALQPLGPLVEEFGVSILVIHHLRQLEAADPLEMISGSSGLTGAADGALVLKRDRGKQDATLVIDGRDIEDTSELALRWEADIASWSLMGDAEEYRMSEERRRILEELRQLGRAASTREITDLVDGDYDATRKTLQRMETDGLLVSTTKGRTKYYSPNSPNSPNSSDGPNSPNGRVAVPETIGTPGSGTSPNSKAGQNPLIDRDSGEPETPETIGTPEAGGKNGSARRLSEDETREVKRLIAGGMAPALARAEVLGEGAV